MKTCLAIQSLRSCALEEAAAIARALGFEAMDLDGVMDSTLSRTKIIGGDVAEVQKVQKLGLTYPNIHWTFEAASLYPAINDPDPAVRKDNKEQIKRLVHFCREADISSILVLPGMLLAGESLQDSRKRSAEALNEFVAIGQEADVLLMFEPHVKSSFESPQSALWLVEQVPGLGIVLDYSHFVCQGYTQPEIDLLLPHTAHIHLRQAKCGFLQTKFNDGTINFGLVLDGLRKFNYAGYLCIEYVHQDFIGADNVDIITETVIMRDFVNAHL